VSDEELRYLERAALTGDLSSALRYLLAFERHGGMQSSPAFPDDFPDYTYTSKYGEAVISPKGKGRDNAIVVYAPTCVPAFKAELEYFAPLLPQPSDMHQGQIAWRVIRFRWFGDEGTTLGYSSSLTSVSDQLETEVAAWVDAHPAEMLYADNLLRQYLLKESLESLHRKYRQVKEQEEDLAKLTIDWLSKKVDLK
jgi:hypothetical protein